MNSEAQPPSPPVPTQQPQPYNDMRPRSGRSAGSFLLHVLWGLTGIVLGVVIGAAGVGNNLMQYLAADGRSTREITEINGRLDELRRDIVARERELSAEREERKEAVRTLKQSVEKAEWNALAATLKGDLVDRFLAHEKSGSDISRAQLVETLCGLLGQRHAARLTIVSTPLELSGDQLRGNLRPDLEQFLLSSGISPDLLARARRSPAQIQIPAITPFNVTEVQRAAQLRRLAMREAHEAIATLQRHVQNIRVPAAARFADGSEYAIPQAVALGMLSRRDCRAS